MMQEVPNQMLRAYKRWLSPVLPASCRFVPTCSEYAAQAVAQRGYFMGGLLALWRLLRCHPFAPGGHDPVPVKAETNGAACVCQSLESTRQQLGAKS